MVGHRTLGSSNSQTELMLFSCLQGHLLDSSPRYLRDFTLHFSTWASSMMALTMLDNLPEVMPKVLAIFTME